MLKSARQFFQSIFIKPNQNDIDHYMKYLNIGEKALFDQLPTFEKVHSILSAKKIQHLIHGDLKFNERIMIRAALLHDVGRLAVKISIFDKVWMRLLKFFLSPIYNLLAGKGRLPDSKLHKIYTHKYHGEIAEDFLKRAETEEMIIKLIASHAQKPKKDDSKELRILRKADRTS